MLDNLINAAYPIMVPSKSYISDVASRELNISLWSNYENMSSFFVEDHLQVVVLPNMQDQHSFNVSKKVKIDENATKENVENRTENITNNHVTSITNKFTGNVTDSTRMYFAVLSCSNATIKYSNRTQRNYRIQTEYILVNPLGEQLPVTDIPYKVSGYVSFIVYSYNFGSGVDVYNVDCIGYVPARTDCARLHSLLARIDLYCVILPGVN